MKLSASTIALQVHGGPRRSNPVFLPPYPRLCIPAHHPTTKPVQGNRSPVSRAHLSQRLTPATQPCLGWAPSLSPYSRCRSVPRAQAGTRQRSSAADLQLPALRPELSPASSAPSITIPRGPENYFWCNGRFLLKYLFSAIVRERWILKATSRALLFLLWSAPAVSFPDCQPQAFTGADSGTAFRFSYKSQGGLENFGSW